MKKIKKKLSEAGFTGLKDGQDWNAFAG